MKNSQIDLPSKQMVIYGWKNKYYFGDMSGGREKIGLGQTCSLWPKIVHIPFNWYDVPYMQDIFHSFSILTAWQVPS